MRIRIQYAIYSLYDFTHDFNNFNLPVAEKDNIAGDSKEEIKEEVNPAFLFESDIKLVNYPEYLKNTAETELGDRNLKRSLRRSQEYLWIDRVVPYEFMSDISGE